MKRSFEISRRQFVFGGIGVATLAVGTGAMLNPGSAKAADAFVLPLPCADGNGNPIIDPEMVRRYAFNHYFQGGCMHGAASGLLQAFKEAYSHGETPWDLLPFGMYKYGAGGVSGWGTLCGILNGCMAILNLIGLHGLLGNDLMGWYATTLLPTDSCEGFVADTGQTAIPDDQVLAHTVADSPLCHISIGKWCNTAGVSVADRTEEGLKYKDDRCSKICADAAAKTAELINELIANGSVTQPFTTPSHYASCVDCHGERKDHVGKMDCMGCHSPQDVVLVSRRHPSLSRQE